MPSRPRRGVLQSAIATGSLLLAGCVSDEPGPGTADDTPTSTATVEPDRDPDWPMFGADAGNSGYAPDVHGPSDAAEIAWRFDGGTPTMNASAVFVDGTVYTGASGDPGGIFAVDPETGEQVWGFEPEGYVTSAPAVVDGTLYVGTWGKWFYALDVADGAEVWSAEVGHRFGEASPTVVDDAVYVATYGDGPLVVRGSDDEEQFEAPAVLALDAATGEERWRYDDFGEKGQLSSSPAADADRVYVGGDDGVLYALDRADGTAAWQRPIAGHNDPDPAVVDGTVYYASLHDRDETPGRLWALDAATGRTEWAFDVADVSLRTSPAVTDETVYLAASTTTACPAVGGTDDGGDSECTSSASGTLYAVDATSGEERWTAAIAADTRSSPAVTDEMVYVGCGSGLSAVTMEGENAWRVDFAEVSDRDSVYVDSSPAVGGGRVIVGCSDGLLYAMDSP